MLDATPLLRLYARARRARLEREDPVAGQQKTLLSLLKRAQSTRFGRDHGFSSLTDVASFQQAVPLRRYEDFWQSYWKDAFPRLTDCSWPGTIPCFAVTSGTTTGRTKYIPCSQAMNRSNRRAALDILVHHLTNRPESHVLGGKNFMLGGSTAFVEEAPGIHSGDLSGIAASDVPWWARPYYFPDRDLALEEDWEKKVAMLAPASLRQDIRSISGTPSWLLLFFDKLAELNPAGSWRAKDAYPNLELVIHGGVNFAPYRGRFAEWLEGSHAETREVYPASEGFFAVADRGDGDGLRLITDHDIFYDFIPVEELEAERPTRHWLATVETGVEYAIAVSTCAGLWSYLVGDTVRFVDLDPPRIVVTGRTSFTLSAFGEHLISAEIEEAVSAAASAIGASVEEFAVTPVFPRQEGEAGRHLYFVEFAEQAPEPGALETFARVLDETLADGNDDYRAHRSGDFGVGRPEIRVVPTGGFAAWMKARGRLGGQNKVPRIINDPDLAENLSAGIETVPR